MTQGSLPKARGGGKPDAGEDRKRRQSQLIQAGIYNPNALVVFLAARGTDDRSAAGGPDRRGHRRIESLDRDDVRRDTGHGGNDGCRCSGCRTECAAGIACCGKRLADFLDLMIVCLHSGLSLQSTIQCVSDELRIAHPEFAGELNIVQRDISLGATVDGALRRFAERTGCDGVGTLAKFVREAQRLGTQLTEALRIHADMLRSQREAAAEEAAQKAAVKILMPTLLLILPAVFIVLAGPAVIQIQQVFAK